jgi:hypothetical protein
MNAGTEHGLMEFFGSASGLSARISPPARILSGVATGVCCVIIPASTIIGLLSILAVLILFLATTGIPGIRLKRLVTLAAIMYFPLFLIASGIGIWSVGNGLAFAARATVPWMALAVKGAATLLVAGGTLSTMTLSEFGGSLRAFRLPRNISIIAMHVLQQTSVMISESNRTRQAILLRGDPARIGTTLLLVRHLPASWLPRLLARSLRVAGAMEVRGYGGVEGSHGPVPWKCADLAALSVAALVVMVSVAIRRSVVP